MLDMRRSRAIARGRCRSTRAEIDYVGSGGAVRPAPGCKGYGNVRAASVDPLKDHGAAPVGVQHWSAPHCSGALIAAGVLFAALCSKPTERGGEAASQRMPRRSRHPGGRPLTVDGAPSGKGHGGAASAGKQGRDGAGTRATWWEVGIWHLGAPGRSDAWGRGLEAYRRVR